MSHFYDGRMEYRYFSKVDRDRSFATIDEVRAYDRQRAVNGVLQTSVAGFDAAFVARDDKLIAMLKFLADELDNAQHAPSPAEPETT